MPTLISLKSMGLVIFSIVVVGCAQGPQEPLANNTVTTPTVAVAKADTVSISPVGVVKAGYQVPVATEKTTSDTTIDNSACSVNFCPLPVRKPKVTVID
ncbi:hypothetical protein [Thiofilum flexile]|uniref:hypothetical protein n=1 Tax=Thiofilum flexile TaxID=125627 RepID=UPI0003A0528C|nr:hypothetical protein [Thiofilum flexile]